MMTRARETGTGMGFEVQPYEPGERPASALVEEPVVPTPATPAADGGESPKRPRLTIVK